MMRVINFIIFNISWIPLSSIFFRTDGSGDGESEKSLWSCGYKELNWEVEVEKIFSDSGGDILKKENSLLTEFYIFVHSP